MTTLSLLNAAAGATGEQTYIEDVFSTYLYTGNGSTQTITNGIALADGFTITPGTSFGGGYLAGFISTSANGVATHALIVSPKATGETSAQWKTTVSSTAGTASLIDGPANSSAMNNASHPAAQFCEGLSIGGYTDWYMPAKNELEVCYFNLKPTTTANHTSSGTNTNAVPSRSSNYTSGSPSQTSVSAFQTGGSEAFSTATQYWTSSEASSTDAWVQFFTNGTQNTDGYKTFSYLVRAVRRIAVTDPSLDPYRVTGKGGMVWIKARNYDSGLSAVLDTTRGATKRLSTNLSDAEYTNSAGVGVTSFNSNGFSLGTGSAYNSAYNYASWTFAKAPKFFDVVTYTGNGSTNRQISHNLGTTPGMVIVKRTSAAANWCVYHRSTGASAALFLDSSNAVNAPNSLWNYTSPTSTAFTVGSDIYVNGSGDTYVAYLFAHDTTTDGLIQCGSFNSADSSGGAVVNLGWEPQYVLIKGANLSDGWFIYDTMRGLPVSSNGQVLFANTSAAEVTQRQVSLTSTGFNARSGWADGYNFIYMAIRRGPMKTPTDGTTVFDVDAYTGNGTANRLINSSFTDDFYFYKNRALVNDFFVFDRLRGNGNYLAFNVTGAEADFGSTWTTFTQTQTGILTGSNTGFGDNNTSGVTNVGYHFRRAPGFFDEVCYTGTGVARTVNHNLGVAPELMIVKYRVSSANWFVYNKDLGSTKGLYLNLTSTPVTSTSLWNDTEPTTSVFTLGTSSSVNTSGGTYVAYLFASCPGVSKVGSYTGTGSTQTVSCGFTGGARFVLIKRTDSTGDWYAWDTARGMVAGTDPRLALNSDAAETNANWVYTTTGGFQIVTTDASVNASGGSYIYLAVA